MNKRVVVIGAGIGGLTAAALLAHEGFQVTVLEAHVYPGGCAGTFYHKGYRFDAGATLAGGFHPGGPHDIVSKLLNIAWPVHRAEPAWTIQLPDRTITRWGDDAHWRDERESKLPELRHFWGLQEHATDAVWRFAGRLPEWPPSSLADVLRLAAKIRPEMIPLAPLALISMGHWLDVLGVGSGSARTFIDAQLLISAQTTSAHANALYSTIALDLPRAGVYHVQGGIGNIAMTLAEALKAQGGQIHYRHEVTRLEVRPDHTMRLETNKGDQYEADIVLANLTPWALNTLLGDQSPTSLRREVAQRDSTWGAFTLYVGIPASAVPTYSDHFQIVKDLNTPLGDGNSVFVSLSDPEDSSRAPQGFRAMTLSTHTHIEAWWNLKNHDPAGYEVRVADYRDRLLDGAERVIPGLRQNATLIMPGTPSAFQYFTRRPGGMVGGFAQTSLFKARGPHTGIPNVWLVGDSIFPGQSTAGVTAGALRVAAEVQRSASQHSVAVNGWTQVEVGD
ncbi:MAG: NAD(P)/FAD-dependent oxidoreductase [Chloroflexota bacterium]